MPELDDSQINQMSAAIKLSSIFEKERNIPNFGNGRIACNLVEVAICTKALNIGIMKINSLTSYMNPNLYSDEILFSLDENCFDYCDKTIVKTKPKIGFL